MLLSDLYTEQGIIRKRLYVTEAIVLNENRVIFSKRSSP